MVVFVDLDDDAFSNQHHLPGGPEDALLQSFITRPEKASLMPSSKRMSDSTTDESSVDSSDHLSTDRYSNQTTFSAALSCYPYGPLLPIACLHASGVSANLGND